MIGRREALKDCVKGGIERATDDIEVAFGTLVGEGVYFPVPHNKSGRCVNIRKITDGEVLDADINGDNVYLGVGVRERDRDLDRDRDRRLVLLLFFLLGFRHVSLIISIISLDTVSWP